MSVENEILLLLRPEWVSRVAREFENFLRALRNERATTESVDQFFTSLPVPTGELEQQIVQVLRRRFITITAACALTPAQRARQLLMQEYQQPWTLQRLARAGGCNRTSLQVAFRRLTSTSVHRFLVRQRISAAQQLLAESDVKVSRIPQEVGYRSHSAFARHFKHVTGSTLTTYRVRHHGLADRDCLP